MEISVRRSGVDDIPGIRSLTHDESFILSKRFGANVNIHRLIETGFLSVTAIDAHSGAVVGFATFSDSPSPNSGIPSDAWPSYLASGWLAAKDIATIFPCNTLWLNFFVVHPGYEADATSKLLTTAFATLPNVAHLLFALPQVAPAFSPLCDLFAALPESGAKMTPENKAFHAAKFQGKILRLHRKDIIPELVLRPGVVEDYDDLTPLLLSGVGVVTPLPDDLYLEELLSNQGPYHAVIVAQDRQSGKVAGLMCLTAVYEEQQHVAKQYSTDIFGRLKPMFTQTHKGQQGDHNTVRISFFYLNPEFDTCAEQFIPAVFARFPFAEFAFMHLPHAAPVHPLLHNFAYVPIKKFTSTPPPPGMYLCCRYAYEPVVVSPVVAQHEASVNKMMSAQAELSQELFEPMCLAFSQSIPVGADASGKAATASLPCQSFVVTWREAVIGVVILKNVTVDEIHALRANFDLEKFVNFSPNGDANYSAVDFDADPVHAPKTYYRNEMPALLVQYCYIRPVFRGQLRFFLREVLRYTGAELLLNLASAHTEVFSPLLTELVYAPPRRVTEIANGPLVPAGASAASPRAAAGGVNGADVDPLLVLHHTTRKLLSDEKTIINARIVVIGSGTTGLAFLYHLLAIPYLHFSNLLLVSQDGLPDHPLTRAMTTGGPAGNAGSSNAGPAMWFADTMDWTEREYLLLKVGKKIRVIEGIMTEFERVDKYITTDTRTYEPYDQLVIATGRQYSIPRDLQSQGAKSGVFPLANSAYVARIKQNILQSEVCNLKDERSRVVVYGANLDAYAVVAAIINLGLSPGRIVLVSPAPATNSPFGDPVIDRRVDDLLEVLGVQQFKDYTLERPEYDEDNALVTVVISPQQGSAAAAAAGGSRSPEIDATMLIYVDGKDIDREILSALNRRSIVFDGRVIVETSYRTTDKSIFAAGPVAMFSRRFGPSKEFEVYSGYEVGRHLAHTVLGFLGIEEYIDPETHQEESESFIPKDDPLAAELGTVHANAETGAKPKRPKPLPEYKENVCRRVFLPTGLVYFSCCSLRSADMPPGSLRYLESTSVDLVPPRPEEERLPPDSTSAYLRVSVSKAWGIIEQVHYIGRDIRELYNFRGLVGMSETVLNLCYNYYGLRDQQPKGHTLDVQNYLRAPLLRAVFADRFPDLVRSIREKLAGHAETRQAVETMRSTLKANVRDTVSDEEKQTAIRSLSRPDSDARHLVELELLKFLHAQKAFSPQLYYLPDVSEHVDQQ